MAHSARFRLIHIYLGILRHCTQNIYDFLSCLVERRGCDQLSMINVILKNLNFNEGCLFTHFKELTVIQGIEPLKGNSFHPKFQVTKSHGYLTAPFFSSQH